LTINFGRDYALLYDALNLGKDYEREAQFIVEKTISTLARDGPMSILDIGCGTGRHLEFLSRSFSRITGLDRSPDMAALAQHRVPHARIEVGDAGTVDLEEVFDVITAVFDVLSYQTTNNAAVHFFTSIRKHLAPGGVALVDFWHLPGLIADPPSTRATRGCVEGRHFLRVSSAAVDWVSATTEVSITTLQWGNSEMFNVVDEKHSMRAFLISEVVALAQLAGLRIDRSGGWLSNQDAKQSDWHAYVTLRHND